MNKGKPRESLIEFPVFVVVSLVLFFYFDPNIAGYFTATAWSSPAMDAPFFYLLAGFFSYDFDLFVLWGFWAERSTNAIKN